MKTTLLFAIFCLGVSISCSSMSKSPGRYLDGILSVPLGSDKAKVVDTFGTPSKIEKEDDGEVYIYSFKYKNLDLPKVSFRLDKNGKVLGKHINLFEKDGDGMNKSGIEALFKNARFVMRDAPLPKNAHYISSFKYLHDDEMGIVVEINTAQADKASYINWSKPVHSAAGQ